MKTYIEIIRELREDRFMKQSEIAQIIGTTQQQYSRYENGENEISIRALTSLADYYGVSTDYLLGRTQCKEGVEGLSISVAPGCSAGKLLSEVMALDAGARQAVVEYVGLHTIKQKWDKLQQKSDGGS